MRKPGDGSHQDLDQGAGDMPAAISMHCFAGAAMTCVRWRISACGNIDVERISTRPRW
jgi:hypothetical protein